MKISKNVLLIGMAVVLAATVPASALPTPIAYEGFDYGTDVYLGQSLPPHNGGSGWAGPWVARFGTPDRDQILSQDSVSLSYGTTTSLATTGGRVDHTVVAGQTTALQRELNISVDLDATGNILYQSFLISQPDTTAWGNRLGAGLANQDQNGRVFCGINEHSDVFLGFSTNSRGTQTSTDLIVPGRTYLFVAKVISSADSGGDWVGLKVYDTTADIVGAEPVALGDWTLQRNVTLTGQIEYWRQETANGIVNGQIDEIRVGDSWEDVTGVPEPATVSLLAFGACALLRRRRK